MNSIYSTPKKLGSYSENKYKQEQVYNITNVAQTSSYIQQKVFGNHTITSLNKQLETPSPRHSPERLQNDRIFQTEVKMMSSNQKILS